MTYRVPAVKLTPPEAADLTGLDLSGGRPEEKLPQRRERRNCVEVAQSLPGVVAVRDSKNPTGPALAFTPGEWRTFLDAVKSGHFD
ncbi:DUF397 domain-containing protein [Streptosporangium fragile]|uniref:DUF397 domain-containing protein n=1 Tax=Streptosporangium fragile TaxID=46186 RepID=UPI0031E8C7E0